MKNTITTRFMSRLFSATEEGDEELTAQVAQDIQDAKRNGAVDTDEVRYENNGDGTVSVIDKDNGEVTVAEEAEDGNFDLYAMPTGNLEQFVHPESDGVTPGYQQGADDECAWSHLEGGVVSPNVPGGGFNPMAGFEPTVEEKAIAPCDNCGEEREFSVATDNEAVLKIFSDQEFCERVFSEVIESEETANIGDIKVEKVDDDTIVITSKSTGDQARVTMTDDEMQIDELTSKDGSDERSFSEEEQFNALHVVGVEPDSHVIVDAPEYDVESAQELVERLSENGVAGVQVFDNQDDARDYAIGLLESLGVESEEDIEEPVETTFSDHTVYITKYYSAPCTSYMERLYSEAEDGVETSQSEIEDAIENSEEIENDSEIITPVDSETAVIEDKETGEFTKVTIDGDELDCKAISREEAEKLVENISVEDEDDDEEERDYSDYLDDDYDLDLLTDRLYSDIIDDYLEDERYFSELDNEYEDEEVYTNDEETKFFSESEELTAYQERLFSGEADESEIEDAIESGEQIENDSEVITPVSEDTAIIEDKETGEFTKAVLDDDTIDVNPISEEEADELTDGLQVEDIEEGDDEEDEKEFSELDYEDVEVVGNPVMEKFFADIQGGNAPQGPAEVTQLFDANGNPAPIAIDANGNPVPVEDPANGGGEAPSVEVIEDAADQAINLIQQAAQEAANQILQAKQAPVQGEEQDLQEAQFSEVELLDVNGNPLISWINGSKF